MPRTIKLLGRNWKCRYGAKKLKAEIVALIEWYDIPEELAIEQRAVNRVQLLEKLRQLLAHIVHDEDYMDTDAIKVVVQRINDRLECSRSLIDETKGQLKLAKEKVTSSTDAIALVCEMGKVLDDKGDLPLWAYRNQARIRQICITQQHDVIERI